MQKLPPDPDVADAAPTDSTLTRYDHEHIVAHLRPLDADAEGADWQEGRADRVAYRSHSRAGARSEGIR